MTREGHAQFSPILVLLCLAGCHSQQPPTYETFAPKQAPYSPAQGSDNAFDGYALAASRLEATQCPSLTRVAFSPGQRSEALHDASSAISAIASASRLPCDFKFSPHEPFGSAPYVKGWKMIGRCLYWRIQDACIQKDFTKAANDTVLATTFGLDLTGGSAIDASLGLQIADDARRALAPNLELMSPSDLRRLETGLKAAISRRPAMSTMIDHEVANSMETLQAIQDAYRDGTLKKIQDQLGPDSKEPIAYLQSMEPTDPKRERFFRGLADYTHTMAAYAKRLVAIPETKRDPKQTPKMPEDHPWHKLSKYVTHTVLPLLEVNDASVARTRLFIIEAELIRQRKLHIPRPKEITTFTAPLTSDPYTGAPFIYHNNGEDVVLYSVGKDGLDNGGETDATFTQPDLLLEKG